MKKTSLFLLIICALFDLNVQALKTQKDSILSSHCRSVPNKYPPHGGPITKCCEPPSQVACNNKCCPGQETCALDPIQGPVCCPQSSICNGMCCANIGSCIQGQCCPANQVCLGTCCPSGQYCGYAPVINGYICCGCPSGQYCTLDAYTNKYTCCNKPTQLGCNGHCCDFPAETCDKSTGNCISEGSKKPSKKVLLQHQKAKK